MRMRAHRIGIIARCDSQEALYLARNLRDYLEKRVEEVQLDHKTGSCLQMEGTPIHKMHADLLISIGGDGTILHAIQHMNDPIPLLGVNMGAVGFLSSVMPENMFKVIDEILENGFDVEERLRLSVSVNDMELPNATNEVVVVTARPAKILEFEVYVNGKLLEEVRADGVVVATPTGSTAYAMSAGGPIIDPQVEASVIVPLAPFKLSARPWVIPADQHVELVLKLPGKRAVAVVDGQHSYEVDSGDHICINRAEQPAKFVRVGEDFYEKVRNKLT